MQILVADDDIDILTTIADQLQLQGFSVDCATQGRQVLELAANNHYDVMVLDVMMPGGDGLTACRQLRQSGCRTPVLFLTARDTLDDKISGFEAGADDYLVKPFAIAELQCRIQALSKRTSHQKISRLTLGDLAMDLDQGSASRAGQVLKLNPLQFKLLRYLLIKAPDVVTRQQLEHELWRDSPPDSDALRSHLYQLRRIIDKPFAAPMLENVRGMGYRLQDPHKEL